ncbi:hypothetical protein Tco_1182281 [Tanacetum coccineum]
MVGDVRTLIIEEAHATKYSVRRGVNEAVARHGVHMLSIPDKDGMYIEVLERDVEVVRNTSRYEYCLPSIDRWSEWAYFLDIGKTCLELAEIGESKMIGLELEQETTKVVVIEERLKKAKDLSPWKGVARFGKKGELAPRLYVVITDEKTEYNVFDEDIDLPNLCLMSLHYHVK